MKDLRKRRILASLTQHQLARQARVDRSKISLVETGQVILTDEEARRVLRVLSRSLRKRAGVIQRVLCTGVRAMGES
jgi:predicted transcriptional regulator